jgi:hypothetical protein
MSLPYVVCDVGGAFAEGQVYVALSRATSIEGLQIANFDPQRVKVSYPAKYFHTAASAASAQRDNGPLESYWSRSHFWWMPIVNMVNTNPKWLELYEGDEHAWQLRRWRTTYPVPPNHRTAAAPAVSGELQADE